MSLKLIYKTEIHKITKQPEDFTSLLKTIREVFGEEIPSQFTLQYEDNENDMVIISCNDDYQLAREIEPLNKSGSLKIFLSDAEDANNISIISRASLLELSPQLKKTSMNKLLTEDLLAVDNNFTGKQSDYDIIHQQAGSTSDQKTMNSESTAPVMQEPYSGVTVMKAYKVESPHVKTTKQEKCKFANEELDMLMEELLENLSNENHEAYEMDYKKSKPAVHKGVQCDICGVFPIVGVRYKCSVLEDFDLCEDCEAVVDHPYPVLKIKNKKQSPSVLVAVFDDDVHVHKDHSKRSRLHKKKHSKSKKYSKQEDINSECKIFEDLIGEFSNVKFEDLIELAGAFKGNLKDLINDLDVQCLSGYMSPQQETTEKKTSTNQREPSRESTQDNDYLSTVVEQFSQFIPKSTDEISGIVNTFANGIGGFLNGLVEQLSDVQNSSEPEPQPQPQPQTQTQTQTQSTSATSPVVNTFKESKISHKIEPEVVLEPVEKKEVPVKRKKQYSSKAMSMAKAIFSIFPQNNFDDICEYVSHRQDKSIDDLVLDYMSSL